VIVNVSVVVSVGVDENENVGVAISDRAEWLLASTGKEL
jgi:hypothetical protein